MVASVSVKGVKKTLKKLGATTEEIKAATDAAVWQEGLDIIANSAKIVPVKHSHLKGSAYAAPPRNGEVEIGYGKDYALPVHDRVEVHHNVGQALYLQKPFEAAQRGWDQRLAKRISLNWKRKIRPGKVRSDFPARPKT